MEFVRRLRPPALAPRLALRPRAWIGACVAAALAACPALRAQTISGSANTTTTLTYSASSTWTQSDAAVTVGGLSFSRGGSGQSITATGALGTETLTFSSTSTPSLNNGSSFSTCDYLKTLNLAGVQGLGIVTGSNVVVLQSGLSMSGLSGTVTLSVKGTDGGMLYAQGPGVLPSAASFAMSPGTGTNGYQYSKLVLNGGATQTIGALSSSGANAFICSWNGSASLLTGGSVAGTNTTGASSPATLRVGNDNGSATFSGVIGTGAVAGGSTVTDASTKAVHLVKLGAGTQTLTGANTYSGNTTVSAGVLALSGSGSIATTAAISVGAGATLNLSAQSSPALNLSSIPLTLGVSTATRGFVNVGSGNLTLGSALTLNFQSSSLGSSYDLYDSGAVIGSFSSVSITGSIGTGSLTNGSGVWSGTIGAYVLSLNQATGVLTVTSSGGGLPPAAPASLTVTDGFEQITLSWSAVADAVSYVVKRSTSPDSGFVTLASGLTGTGYTDTTATLGVTYYYVVTAVNVNGESDPSPSGSGLANIRAAIGINLRAYNTYGLPITDLAGVSRKAWWNNLVGPSFSGESATLRGAADYLGNPVAGLVATFVAGSTSASGGATVKFGADAVTVGPASNDLNLYSSVFDQYNGTASTLSVTGIPYSSYDFVVYVYDGGSARGGVITANGSTLAIRGGAGSPAADGSGYVRSTDAANTSGSSVQQGNYVRFTGRSGNLTATFLATNVGDSTQRLKIAGFQILSNDLVVAPSSAPAAPSALSASAGNSQVALNWTHDPAATSYKVYRGGALLATVLAPACAYADATVSNGTAYSYAVSAANAVGEGAKTATVSATPAAPAFTLSARDVYQYSIPVTAIYSTRDADPLRRAYLWVPPGLSRLQGVVVGLHNMLEKPMFEDPVIRQACADAGLGIVFITPGDAKVWTPNGVGNYSAGLPTTALNLDPNDYGAPDVNPATGSAFASDAEQAAAELAEIFRRLAVESGYSELQYAPVVLAGHSAASPFVWTRGLHLAAALSGRVAAILAYKGYYPGSISDGIPVFHVSSEWQEISQWGNTWELGDAPQARALRAGGVNRLVGEYVQPGTGHYHYADAQSGPVGAFLKSAAALRIPANWTASAAPTLNAVAASDGWLVDVTQVGSGSVAPVAYADWVASGKNPVYAYWYPSQAVAQAVCDAMNAGFSKKPQLISAFASTGASTLPNLASQSNGEGFVRHTATLQADGVTFQLRAASLNQSPIPKLLYGAPVGIPSGSIQLKVNRSGALKQTGVDTFRVWLDRGSVIKTGQPWEPFVIAWHPGDANYRSADRPVFLSTSVAVNLTGASGGSAQTITFSSVANQSADQLGVLSLSATSSAGASYPVQYFMVSGPYRNEEVDSGILVPDTVPAGAKFPMRVVVGAWQWGKPGVYQSAAPVFRTFWIFKDRFQKWQFEQFGSTASDGTPVIPSVASDPASDPDGDGLNNLLEYATGHSPASPDASAAQLATTEGRLQLTFDRVADPALVYAVEATDDLGASWTQIWTSTGAANVAGSVTVPDTQTLSGKTRRFLRLRVVR